MRAARRLLVGFDGSPASVNALRRAARTARRNHGCLLVVSVVTDQAGCVLVSPLGLCVAIPEDPEQTALDSLQGAVEALPEDVSVCTVVCRGRVGPVLAAQAIRHGCDAIVIGAHHGFWSWLTGGVEGYLRRHSQTRLIVDRPSRQRSKAAASGPRRWRPRSSAQPPVAPL